MLPGKTPRWRQRSLLRRAVRCLAGTETERLALEALAEDPAIADLLTHAEADDGDMDAGEGGATDMAKDKVLFDAYHKLIAGVDLPHEEERRVIDEVTRSDPTSLPHLCLLFANQKQQLRGELAKARAACSQAEELVARVRQPPWFPADVLRRYPDHRLEVVVGGRRQVVTAVPELADEDLRPGDEVFLDRDLTVAVTRNDEPRLAGLVATVVESANGHVILRGIGDEELVALCSPDLRAALHPGDRVLYKRDAQYVVARLAERTQSPYLLGQPPRVRFADIGGLNHVIDEIRRDLDLHLLRPEVAAAYRLRLMRGLTLVGPPGTGKTMLAGAVAGYLSETRPDTRFLHVKPGALRGMYYGETEARIRELFTVARRAPGLVVIFFDELDTFGARGSGIGHEIDDRVMGALLAEIDGLEPSDYILCIGATNRLDLCDDALVRQGRLADRIYHVQRPGREAARQIFARYLPPDLPYAADGEASTGATAVIDAAVGFLFAPRGGAGSIATVTLADSTRHEITAPAVISGALIASAVERAKHVAAARHADGSGGLAVEDVLAALDQALSAETDKIRSPAAARRTLDFPGAADIVHVDIPANRRPRRYRYLRAA